MAGHSKFKNIMHRKGAQDKKRAKIFARCSREIIVAAKSGMPDPADNPRLRGAIQAARAQNMPMDNIDRAIKKAIGGGEGTDLEEIRYEGYGPGGVAVIVEVLTDNRNRSASEVRAAFSKAGGSMGETNSVSFMFERVGQIIYPADKASDDEMFEAAVEAGAQDVISDGSNHEVITSPEEFGTVRDALIESYGDPEEMQLTWKPNTLAPLDEDKAKSVLKFIDVLDDNDDVQTISANYDISDEIMEKLIN
ncbi:YebC/PmpR family DNA-binding transcriptional regulator [Rhodovibrionaceae bacterium A322]